MHVPLARCRLKPEAGAAAAGEMCRGAVAWVARRDTRTPTSMEEFTMTAAAVPLAIAGTGYGLIGLLIIIVLVLVIWRLI